MPDTQWCRTATVAEVEAEYIRAKEIHFNSTNTKSDPNMYTDAEFNDLENYFREIDPNNPHLDEVGAPPPIGCRVILPYRMPSMPKVHANGQLKAFLKAHPGPYQLSDKVDGVSLLLDASSTDGHRLFTRGNGLQGMDVSVLLPHIQHKGRILPAALRGELVIPHKAFTRWHAEEYENARGLVSGIVNSAGRTGEINPDIRSAIFIVHSVVNPPKPLHQAAFTLIKAGWALPYLKTARLQSLDVERNMLRYLQLRKNAVPYAIDGVVIRAADGATVAFKGMDEEAIVEVERVAWQTSRYGVLKPVAIFPGVYLGGVTVTRATAHNAGNVVNKGIGPGAKIRIVRKGDVIPKIVGVVVGTNGQLPTIEYDWDKTGTNILLRDRFDDKGVKVRQLTNFVQCMGVEGIKDRTTLKLVEVGIDDPKKLIEAVRRPALLDRAGLGPAATKNLIYNLKRGIDTSTHLDMMIGCGLFPSGFRRERFELLLNAFTFEELKAYAAGSAAEFITTLNTIHGFGTILSRQMREGLLLYIPWIESIGWTPAEQVSTAPVNGPLTGSNVVFTKIRDPGLQGRIVALGGKLSNRVTAETRWVIALDGSFSSKTERAIEKGVPILTLEQLDSELCSLEGE